MNAPEVRKIVEEWLADRITGVNLGLPEKMTGKVSGVSRL